LKLALSAVLIYFSWLLHRNSVVIYAMHLPVESFFSWIIAGNLVLSILLCLLLTKENIQKSALLAFRSVSTLSFVALAGALALVPIISPKPFIDVWVNNQAAVDFLAQGLNPYSQSYMDIYHGRYDYHAGFLYFPGILYWLAPFRFLLGDIRFGLVFANLATAVGLIALSRRLKLAETFRWLIPLIWLAFPVTFFVAEQAWIDTILITLAVLALWSAEARRFALAGVLGGLAFSMKQYGFLITGIVLFRIWRLAGFKPTLRATVSASASFLVVVLPFALADWDAFYESTIGGHADSQVRLDAFNFTVFLYREAGILIPGFLRVVLSASGALFSAVWMLRKATPRLSDAAAALSVSYGMAFLFGKWAFCNYHYLLAGFVVLFILTSLGERSQAH
jgi:hypothetical protein